MRTAAFRTAAGALFFGTWFITLAGGWRDIGSALARELRPEAPAHRITDVVLSGTALSGGDLLAMPTRISVAEEELLVVDRYRGEALVALDRRTGQLLRSFGTKGEGPAEFAGPVSTILDGQRTGVLDAGLNRVTWLGRAADSGDYVLSGNVSLQMESTALDLVATPSGRLLASGFFGASRLFLLDASGKPLRRVGEVEAANGLPAARRAELYQGTLRATPDLGRFVLTSRFASRVEVWSSNLDEPLVVRGPSQFGPRAGPYTTRFGYLDSAPGSQSFFALFSGRTREEFPGRANFGSEIHEFGWDGTLLMTYQVDADLISIAWSEEDRLLYAIRYDPLPSIVVYSLNIA